MRVVLQKVDMDTCLTGLILGADLATEVIIRAGEATAEELSDEAVLCIEAGGSGDVARRNFDHHGPGAPDEPACVQAARHAGLTDSAWLRLVDYVAAIDLGTGLGGGMPGFPTLSSVFSGMMIAERNGHRRFSLGMALFKEVITAHVDPFGTMPERPDWAVYIVAKHQARLGLSEDIAIARVFQTKSGAQAGFVASAHPSALGALYELGCRYAIAYAEQFTLDDGSTIRKFTVGAIGGARVDCLLPVLNQLEAGWGGPSHGTIIGSPRMGTAVTTAMVCELVRNHC